MKKLQRFGLILSLFGLAASEIGVALAQGPGEVMVAEGTRITLQLNEHLSTKLNSEGDTFTAVVSVPVLQGDRIVIPKGSIISGSISRVVRPGRFKGKAVMTLLFQSIRISGRGKFDIVASLARVDPEGNSGVKSEGTIRGEGSPGSDVARIVKPSLGGAGIGALAGGARGSAIGAGVGAIVGLGTVFATRGKDLEVARGSTMDIVLDRPLVIPLEPAELGASSKNR
jgi:hypothetical protein